MEQVPKEGRPRVRTKLVQLCPARVDVTAGMRGANPHATRLQRVRKRGIPFAFDHRQEGVVEVKDDEGGGILGLDVEDSHGLCEELVVEGYEGVLCVVALLEVAGVGCLREATQRLEASDCDLL